MNNIVSITKTHVCSECNVEKAYEEYPKKKATKTGYSLTRCRVCHNERQRNIRAGNTVSTSRGPEGIITHNFSRPSQGTPLRSKYDMLNPKLYTQWSTLNEDNDVLVQQVGIMRTEMLKGRDAWHEREFHATLACGYFHSVEMHGADAYKKCGQPVELKVNWVSNDPSNSNTLNGGGSFNDYNEERLEKLLSQNYALLIPCYIDHKLICAAEVPVNYKPLADKLYKDLQTAKGRVCLRFTFTDWIDCPEIKWHVVPDLKEMIQYKHKFSPAFFDNILNYMNDSITVKKSTDVK